ncbi:MAG: hypothetical protein H6510_13700 [Acidobacteria bacterium]|nr:hypothetical protein [Acidobacteriota bacterium]MCB9398862.1 hypothetical protein [Acidobacteriota bacterium]
MSQASDLIHQIQGDLHRLQRDYNQFFGGVTPIEPMEARDALMEKVKILRNMTKLKTEENFLADNLIGKVQSYVMMWERQLQAKEGRRPSRRKVKTVDPQHSEPPSEQAAPARMVTLKDPSRERGKVVELFEEYVKMNLMAGSRQQVSFAKFQSLIQAQTDKLKAAKNAQSVSFEVVIKENRVLLKSKSQ